MVLGTGTQWEQNKSLGSCSIHTNVGRQTATSELQDMSDVTKAAGGCYLYKVAFKPNPGGSEGVSLSRAYVFQKERAGSAKALWLESTYQV